MIKKGRYIAVRPNALIEARYDLTSSQNDILDMVLSKMDDDDNYLYELNINDYKKLYNTDTSNIYRDLKKAVKQFEGSGFYLIDNENKKEIFFAWFASILYSDAEGKIIIEVGQRLKRLLVEMKKRIYYKIEYPLNFSSTYSKRMYYYLKGFEDTGWRIDNLDTLRKKLQCPKSYDKYSFFRIRVLEMAQKEINNNSDIFFTYEEKKTGRKVTNIKFYINTNRLINNKDKVKDEIAACVENFQDQQQTIDDISNIKQVQAICYKHKITDHEASCILKDANNNLDLIKQCYQYSLGKDVKNIVGYIRKLVKGFNSPQDNNKTDKFNDYTQRTYDFEDLEKRLTNWENNY